MNKNLIIPILIIMFVGMAAAITPSIQHYFPVTDPSDPIGTARTFTVVVNQSVTNTSWYVGGVLKQSNLSGYTLTYTNTSSATGEWNVSVNITGNDANSSNTTSHLWTWTVIGLYPPGISGYGPATDPTDLTTSSRTFNVTVNQTSTIRWYINGTLKQTDSSATDASYTNSTAPQGTYNVSVNVTSANSTTSRMWTWTRTTAPAIISYAPALTISDINANITRTFNVTADRATNFTWYIDGIIASINTTTETISNYTNSTPLLGTHNVSVRTNNTNGTGNMVTWSWTSQSSTTSGTSTTTNLSSTGRALSGTNMSLNFSWTDTGNITTVNFTFPAGFVINATVSGNVVTNLGIVSITLNPLTRTIGIYNSTGLNNSAIYVNFTANIVSPVTAGNYIVNITTNKKSTNISFTVYSRDTTKPYFSVGNNSVFTISSETFGTLTTTVSLIGSGASNLTFYAPNVTGQTNFTAGYGATNASRVTAVYSPGAKGNYTIYVEVNPTVTNPIITLSATTELQSSNLPAVVIAVLVSGATVVYIFRRRRH